MNYFLLLNITKEISTFVIIGTWGRTRDKCGNLSKELLLHSQCFTIKSVSLRSTSLNVISKRTLFDCSIRESTKSNQTKIQKLETYKLWITYRSWHLGDFESISSPEVDGERKSTELDGERDAKTRWWERRRKSLVRERDDCERETMVTRGEGEKPMVEKKIR